MNLKDYLHLYLGCEIVVDGEQTVLTSGELDYLINFFENKEEVKLVLRPLSDMTEEEMIELWNSIFWYKFPANGDFRRIDKKTTASDPRWVLTAGVERLGIEDNGTVWADCDLSHYKHNQHEVTRWFLSKHFDLFGLLEAGLAIDKSKLNNVLNGAVSDTTESQ